VETKKSKRDEKIEQAKKLLNELYARENEKLKKQGLKTGTPQEFWDMITDRITKYDLKNKKINELTDGEINELITILKFIREEE
ncbi:MAG: hypothetical protein NC918_02590, partial [Candidatus Omnitrophica bacterium]|nr:hypothetical protein [Candidatus Omnitrophota bacterium]